MKWKIHYIFWYFCFTPLYIAGIGGYQGHDEQIILSRMQGLKNEKGEGVLMDIWVLLNFKTESRRGNCEIAEGTDIIHYLADVHQNTSHKLPSSLVKV